MQAPVVRHHKDGTRTLDMLTWGLVPFFSKEPVLGKMINARSEEAAIKPSFRAAYQKRRCLVPASGFYEWRAIEGSTRKQPYYFQARSGEPFFFAGLWEFWKPREGAEETAPRKKQQSEDGSLTTFTILTGKPNELVAPIHDRMPVIVRPGLYDLWLDPAAPPDTLSPVLEPFSASEMEAYPVGRGLTARRMMTRG
jgi:putative SOS response-associated peptidase YedK